jgi:hypothetical protein
LRKERRRMEGRGRWLRWRKIEEDGGRWLRWRKMAEMEEDG